MSRLLPKVLSILVFTGLAVSCGKRDQPAYLQPPGTSWSSVLANAADIATIAEPVQAWERSLHFSSSVSTNKVLLANLAPEITGDMDHGFFLDVVEHAAGVDATLAEVHGKGMISWIWSANPAGIIRLFVDDEAVPAVEMPFKDFLIGTFLPVAYPFSARTSLGYNLHFPILHEQYCKVIVRVDRKKDLASLYYQIAWDAVDPAQTVTRFSLEDLSKGDVVLNKLAESLLKPDDFNRTNELAVVDLPAGQLVELFSSEGEGTITHMVFQADNKAVLSQFQIVAFWDGSEIPNIDCPLYLLAGTSERMENVKNIPIDVNDATATIRWPMPYKSARLAIRNNASESARLKYAIRTSSRSELLRFGGQYRMHAGLWTDRHNILTLASMHGSGRIVGCNLQVKSRTDKWWGEGDQLIYLNSFASPTWQGTGTEDYFGFAWCSTKAFHHPFRGQSSVREDSQERTSAMHRYHFLDRLPFHHLASFQTEAWGLSEGTMDYESLILYYQHEVAH